MDNDYETSELILYESKILHENGQAQEALVHLRNNEQEILDKVARLESLSQVAANCIRIDP